MSNCQLKSEFPILESGFCDKSKAMSAVKKLYSLTLVFSCFHFVSLYLSENVFVFYKN